MISSISSSAVFKSVNPACDAWHEKALTVVASLKPKAIFLSDSYTYKPSDGASESVFAERWGAALNLQLKALQNITPAIGLLEDVYKQPFDPLACHVESVEGRDCRLFIKPGSMPGDLVRSATRSAVERNGIKSWNPSDSICPDGICPVLIEGVFLYRDTNHISATASRMLAPKLTPFVLEVLSTPPAINRP